MDTLDLTSASKRYAVYMHEIRSRLKLVGKAGGALTAGRSLTGLPAADVELCFLNFRKILELIMYSSVLAHKDAGAEISRKIAGREWNARKIFKYLEQVNPNFYPNPIEKLDREVDPPSTVALLEGYLTKEEFLHLYDHQCGKMLHASRTAVLHEPYTPPEAEIKQWFDRIWMLLGHHWIQLSDELCFAVILTLNGSDKIQVAPMTKATT
ncbi:hypothetical protein [Marinobacter zhanjiangensis]|uniref:HEPN AbiU2-like domain-containing protein n=1 Tax=Marinobacter zhanjiangensis TaxID=578215 RepID=A0ABQ3BA12_9GAMM|nr:hypothetical protein [Marinobacter zhanjiangensis]GGY85534.1 hypothetical protein GCM10007071_36140 [Marinobacter zhanjiangensis]